MDILIIVLLCVILIAIVYKLVTYQNKTGGDFISYYNRIINNIYKPKYILKIIKSNYEKTPLDLKNKIHSLIDIIHFIEYIENKVEKDQEISNLKEYFVNELNKLHPDSISYYAKVRNSNKNSFDKIISGIINAGLIFNIYEYGNNKLVFKKAL